MASTAIDRLDGLSSSTAIKGPCRVATTANITLSGLQTIDGVALAADDRVLVKDQTETVDNGIYIASIGGWRRSRDFYGARDVTKGTRVYVNEGAVGIGSCWSVTTENPIVVGSSNIEFSDTTLGPAVIDDDTMATATDTNVPTSESIKAYVDAKFVASRTALKAIDTTAHTTAFLTEAGREGLFLWRSGNYSARITADTAEGVYVKANAIAASSGSWVRVYDDALLPEFFGAAGDGTTNDTTAFAGMVSFVNALGGAIRLPAKSYVLREQLVFTGLLSLKGAGIRSSRMVWDSSSTSEGIRVNLSNSDYFGHVTVADVSLLSLGQLADTALHVDGSAQVSGSPLRIQTRELPRCTISNVAIAGATGSTTDGWTTGVDLEDVLNVIVTGCRFRGKYTSPYTVETDIASQTAYRVRGTGRPVETLIEKCWAYWAVHAVYASDCEGLFVDNCNFVVVFNGVRHQCDPRMPQCNVTNSHINALKRCVWLQSVTEFNISGNLFYRQAAGETGTGVFVEATAASGTPAPRYGRVINNGFAKSGSPNFNGVVIDGSEHILVDGNVFQDVTTAIWLRTTTVDTLIGRGNKFATVTDKIIDATGLENVRPGQSAALEKDATQAITTATSTALTWQTVVRDDGGYYSVSNTTRLTARTAGRYRANASVQWAANATGTRAVWFRRNGSDFGTRLQLNAPASGAAYQAISSAIIDLTAGQYIEVFVNQSSGGNLDVTNATFTNFSLERIS